MLTATDTEKWHGLQFPNISKIFREKIWNVNDVKRGCEIF